MKDEMLDAFEGFPLCDSRNFMHQKKPFFVEYALIEFPLMLLNYLLSLPISLVFPLWVFVIGIHQVIQHYKCSYR